jgi:putative endonuclease
LANKKNIDTGNQGELDAIAFLKHKGYTILHHNWRAQHNEIDIVALHNGLIIIVEVKARVTDNTGHPEQAITKAKIKELKKATQAYMDAHPDVEQIRFDVIAITYWPGESPEIVHFEDAFF